MEAADLDEKVARALVARLAERTARTAVVCGGLLLCAALRRRDPPLAELCEAKAICKAKGGGEASAGDLAAASDLVVAAACVLVAGDPAAPPRGGLLRRLGCSAVAAVAAGREGLAGEVEAASGELAALLGELGGAAPFAEQRAQTPFAPRPLVEEAAALAPALDAVGRALGVGAFEASASDFAGVWRQGRGLRVLRRESFRAGGAPVVRFAPAPPRAWWQRGWPCAAS